LVDQPPVLPGRIFMLVLDLNASRYLRAAAQTQVAA
jgi:hypothetical protein